MLTAVTNIPCSNALSAGRTRPFVNFEATATTVNENASVISRPVS